MYYAKKLYLVFLISYEMHLIFWYNKLLKLHYFVDIHLKTYIDDISYE